MPMPQISWDDVRLLPSLRRSSASDASAFELRAITDDRVYGVWTDELDVEQVRIYELLRS